MFSVIEDTICEILGQKFQAVFFKLVHIYFHKNNVKFKKIVSQDEDDRFLRFFNK